MQYSFQQLLSWSKRNDMVVNVQKTTETVTEPPSLVSNFQPIPRPTGCIEQVSAIKLLGLHLHANFSWQSHTEVILSKATQRLYLLQQDALRCKARY